VCTTCLYSFAYQGKRRTPSYKKRNNTQFIGSENSAKDIQSLCDRNLNDKIARMSNELIRNIIKTIFHIFFNILIVNYVGFQINVVNII